MRVLCSVTFVNLRPGVAENRKAACRDFFPYLTHMSQVINIQGNYAHLTFVEFLLVPRELAQLSHAIWSPVSTIENYQHMIAAQSG